MELLFIISIGARLVIQLVMRIFGKVFISSWLNRIKQRFSKTIIVSDFRMNIVAGKDLPWLRFTFKIYNGTISAINLKGIVINLYCGADSYVTSIAGQISDISLVSASSTKVGKGKAVDVGIDILPSLEFWLPLRITSFSLRKSSIIVSTVWGDIIKPLEPDRIQDNIKASEEQIAEYISKVKRSLSV